MILAGVDQDLSHHDHRDAGAQNGDDQDVADPGLGLELSKDVKRNIGYMDLENLFNTPFFMGNG